MALLVRYEGVGRIKALGVLLLTEYKKGRFLTVLTNKKAIGPEAQLAG